MSENDGDSDQESGDEDGSDGGEEDNEDAERDEAHEGLGVGEGPAQDDEGLIRWTEEVEEEPGGEEADEDDEREGVGEERNGDDEGDDGEVVDAEVGVVLADADGGVGERLGFGECGSVGELGPGSALGEAVADGVGDVVDEGAEGRGGDRGLTLQLDRPGGGGGDREDWWDGG